ncbi:MAG: peptidoglycan-binding protein [Candidatus Brocadiae bacterium]|nr:peptidoglycan-binding protein [Candidatus Brocadiia bacterium]
MKKQIFFLLFCYFFCFSIVVSQEITAKAYLVWDVTENKILKEKDPLVSLPPASTIKLLTAMVVLDHAALDKSFVVSENATKVEPKKLGIGAGDSMRCEDLLMALFLNSANDVAVILAEGVAQNQKNFADLMNKKAKELGCKNSFFCNPNGLPDKNQYSCACDLAILAYAAYQYEPLKKILATRKASVKSTQGKTYNLYTQNKFSENIYGKTGYTDKSQNTFAGIMVKGDKLIAFSILGSYPRSAMWNELAVLLEVKSPVKQNKAKASSENSAKASSENPSKDVKTIQSLLHKKGYYKGKIDGVYGAQTQVAVKKFQQDNGLKADGKVGENTWKKLNAK